MVKIEFTREQAEKLEEILTANMPSQFEDRELEMSIWWAVNEALKEQ